MAVAIQYDYQSYNLDKFLSMNIPADVKWRPLYNGMPKSLPSHGSSALSIHETSDNKLTPNTTTVGLSGTCTCMCVCLHVHVHVCIHVHVDRNVRVYICLQLLATTAASCTVTWTPTRRSTIASSQRSLTAQSVTLTRQTSASTADAW